MGFGLLQLNNDRDNRQYLLLRKYLIEFEKNGQEGGEMEFLTSWNQCISKNKVGSIIWYASKKTANLTDVCWEIIDIKIESESKINHKKKVIVKIEKRIASDILPKKDILKTNEDEINALDDIKEKHGFKVGCTYITKKIIIPSNHVGLTPARQT